MHRVHPNPMMRLVTVFAAALMILGIGNPALASEEPVKAQWIGNDVFDPQGYSLLVESSIIYGSKLYFQNDGNLVLYRLDGGVAWQSGTAGIGDKFILQSDGNAVIYDGYGRARWATHTAATWATDGKAITVGRRCWYLINRNLNPYASAGNQYRFFSTC